LNIEISNFVVLAQRWAITPER